MNDEELQSIINHYGDEKGDIKYLDFLTKSTPEELEAGKTNVNYQSQDWSSFFKGETEIGKLLHKIKVIVKKNRIRLLEFFQDHDILRKGHVPYMKFKGVLHSQKIELTNEEHDLLLNFYKTPSDPNLINYKSFDDHLEKIFVEKELEKAPTKRWTEFKAPSILDPLDVLSDSEEGQLQRCLVRIGIETKNRRLLIKPYFQDKVSDQFY